MPIFSSPSPSHERVPKSKRYCTNCRRDVEVVISDSFETYCPVCHEQSLLPTAKDQRQEGRK